MEVSADGFGTRRFALVDIPESALREFPPVRLKRARVLQGRVVGADGEPLARARVRVIGKRIAPLPSPAGDLDLYDPEIHQGPVTTTDAKGRFEIRNEVAGDPLLAAAVTAVAAAGELDTARAAMTPHNTAISIICGGL